MSQYTSYYLYQKYEKRGEQDWIPVYPNTYSIDGDGTMPLSAKTENDPACGYVPVKPIYRWFEAPSTDYVCNGYNKYHKEYYQVSNDNGVTWTNVVPEQTRQGSLIEVNSSDCGYVPPVDFKLTKTYSDSKTYIVNCNSSTILQQNEVVSEYPQGIKPYAMLTAEIGNCVTEIGVCAFQQCYLLSSVTISDSVSMIDSYAFHQCSGLTSVEIPSGVTSIGEGAFQRCNHLTSINIPSGITSLERGIFSTCYSLSSITIPNSVTSIGPAAFANCSGLTSIEVPSGVTYIGDEAFRHCSNLTGITVNAVIPPAIGYSVFDDTNNCPIYVPAESVNTYKNDSSWHWQSNRIQAIS